MIEHGSATRKLWGPQYPFERNHLQRSMTIAELGLIFSVSLILLVHDDVRAVAGIALVFAGMGAGLAAVSRRRYVRETEVGFSILEARDGRFVLWSAAAFATVGVLVVAVILL